MMSSHRYHKTCPPASKPPTPSGSLIVMTSSHRWDEEFSLGRSPSCLGVQRSYHHPRAPIPPGGQERNKRGLFHVTFSLYWWVFKLSTDGFFLVANKFTCSKFFTTFIPISLLFCLNTLNTFFDTWTLQLWWLFQTEYLTLKLFFFQNFKNSRSLKRFFPSDKQFQTFYRETI